MGLPAPNSLTSHQAGQLIWAEEEFFHQMTEWDINPTALVESWSRLSPHGPWTPACSEPSKQERECSASSLRRYCILLWILSTYHESVHSLLRQGLTICSQTYALKSWTKLKLSYRAHYTENTHLLQRCDSPMELNSPQTCRVRKYLDVGPKKESYHLLFLQECTEPWPRSRLLC